MALDIKHMNIGATVSMLRLMQELDGGQSDDALTELFMVESVECDYKLLEACTYNDSLKPDMLCCIGECPLGAEVDKKLKLMSLPDVMFRLYLSQ